MSSTSNEVTVAFQPLRRLRAASTAQCKQPLQPARVARQLALAHVLQQRIDSGEFKNQAALARALAFSRERISKIMDLLLLAPDIQEEILLLERGPGSQPCLEADLYHHVLNATRWDEQRQRWAGRRAW